MEITIFLAAGILLPYLAAIFAKGRYFLHMAQLEGYHPVDYLHWILKNKNKLSQPTEWIAWGLLFLFAISLSLFLSASGWTEAIFPLLWAGIQIHLTIYYIRTQKKSPPKKPLVWTARATRLMLAFLILTGLGALSSAWLIDMTSITKVLLWWLILIVLNLLIPAVMLLALLVITPLEGVIHFVYFTAAQRKIRKQQGLKVIGITGSYGKTSAKYILAGLLKPHFSTLSTPESYNTPMGVCKIINRKLTGEHQFFVTEMGARRPGDIKKLCRLVSPQIGILTSIGPQHLETFKTLERIVRTKGELLSALPSSGLAILNFDDPHCRRLAEGLSVPCRSFGIDCPQPLDIRAKEIQWTPRGLSFAVETKAGRTAALKCRFLGRHNVYNILAAALAAQECGLSIAQIASALVDIPPVPHRLELIRNQTGIAVIDDAYNSNPVGAKEALEVLRLMPGGQKILITPGMVELGDQEYELNREMGRAAAKVCDIVILVGPRRTKAIREGLVEAQLPEARLRVARNLEEARVELSRLIRTGDVVLFENDLPDNYSE